MPRDAERWLAERGIEREPIRLTPTDAEVAADTSGPDPSVREVTQLAREQHDEAARHADERAAARPVGGRTLEDDVAEALQFLRRSTATAPQSVGRLRRKLAERGTPDAVVDLAIERAHAERLVDDDAIAAALIEERRAKGHAPARLRTDLSARGFDRATVDRALASVEAEDPEAAAFAVARAKADRLTAVAAETAVRRVVGHLARRGYPDGLARKVAREAVDVSRDPARTAGR